MKFNVLLSKEFEMIICTHSSLENNALLIFKWSSFNFLKQRNIGELREKFLPDIPIFPETKLAHRYSSIRVFKENFLYIEESFFNLQMTMKATRNQKTCSLTRFCNIVNIIGQYHLSISSVCILFRGFLFFY